MKSYFHTISSVKIENSHWEFRWWYNPLEQDLDIIIDHFSFRRQRQTWPKIWLQHFSAWKDEDVSSVIQPINACFHLLIANSAFLKIHEKIPKFSAETALFLFNLATTTTQYVTNLTKNFIPMKRYHAYAETLNCSSDALGSCCVLCAVHPNPLSFSERHSARQFLSLY